jgi:hypothetical protein
MTAPEIFQFSERITNPNSICKGSYTNHMERLAEGRIVASDLRSIHFAFHPNFFSSWPISTPGDVMFKWPPLFPWRSTTGRCWPKAHRLPRNVASGRRGPGMSKIRGKVRFHLILCYHATHEKGCLWKREGFSRLTSETEVPNTLLEPKQPRLLHNLGLEVLI